MAKELICTMFGGEDAHEYNALMSALIACAEGENFIYRYLENTPKTSLIVELTDALHDFGYEIIRK